MSLFLFDLWTYLEFKVPGTLFKELDPIRNEKKKSSLALVSIFFIYRELARVEKFYATSPIPVCTCVYVSIQRAPRSFLRHLPVAMFFSLKVARATGWYSITTACRASCLSSASTLRIKIALCKGRPRERKRDSAKCHLRGRNGKYRPSAIETWKLCHWDTRGGCEAGSLLSIRIELRSS